GEITIDGKDITTSKNKDLAKKISILKQSNSMNLKLTVRELISFGRFPYSQGRLKDEDWQKVDEAIEYMELGDMHHKFLDELSEITNDGKDITTSKNKDLAKKISILKQSNSINLKLTVRELISFGRFPYSQGRLKDEDWQKVDEAIEYMELGDMQHKFLDELS